MSLSKLNKKKAVAVNKDFNKWFFVPLIIMVLVVPVVVIAHKYEHGLNVYDWFDSSETITEVFLYFKAKFVYVAGALGVCLMVYMVYKDKGKFFTEKDNTVPVIAAGIFAVGCLVSAFLSEHAEYAFFGGYGRYEGVLVLLSYVVCFYMAFGYLKTLDLVKFVMDALMIAGFIIGLIGVLQFIGIDLLQTSFFEWFMNLDMKEAGFEYVPTLGSGIAYSTLYNPNYVGSYVPLVLPYFLYATVRSGSIFRKIFAGATSVLTVIMLVGSKSTTGIVMTCLAIGVFVILILPSLNKVLRMCLISAGVVVIGVGVYMLVAQGKIANMFVTDPPQYIDDMKTAGNKIYIKTNAGPEIKLEMAEDVIADSEWARAYDVERALSVTDTATGKEIHCARSADNHLTIDEEGYPTLSFYLGVGTVSAEESGIGEEILYGQLHVDDSKYDWIFTTDENMKLKFINPYKKMVSTRYVPRVGFEGRYDIASGRGYIWAHTLPLLPKTLLVGVGPDNFIYVYGNDDYIEARQHSYEAMVASNPHNTFLQIWTEDGLPTMLVYIVLYVVFLIRVLKLCFGKSKIESGKGYTAKGIAVALAAGTTGYMLAGLTNDSMVCVAPVYWVLLGVGYAVVRICRTQISEKEKALAH